MANPTLYELQPGYEEFDTLSFVVSYSRKGEPIYPLSANAFQNCFDRTPLLESWKPPPVIIERDEQRTDIYEIESCFAVNEKARQALSRLIGTHVEFLPVDVVGERHVDADDECHTALAKPPKLYLLNPLIEVELGKGSISEKMAYRHVTKYVFNPDDLNDLPIFRAREDLCVLVSDSFRHLVRSKRLRGLDLEEELDWHASTERAKGTAATKARPSSLKHIAAPALIPEDELLGARRMTNKLWENAQDHWSWICNATKAHDGSVDQKLKIAKPISEPQLETLRKKVGGDLPREFEQVLTKYARKVSFSWDVMESQFSGELPKELAECCGCFSDLWDVDTLPALREEAEKHRNSDSSYFQEAFDRRLPFIDVGTGDYIAFDMRNGTHGCPIVYLSHENADSHNCVLARNFIEFLLRWSGVGCVGPDFPYLEAFYDGRKKRIHCHGRNAKKWRTLMASGV